jgi:hypothetical protein
LSRRRHADIALAEVVTGAIGTGHASNLEVGAVANGRSRGEGDISHDSERRDC